MGLAGGLASNGQSGGGGGGSGTVTAVTAGSGKITVATGTTTPVIDLGTVPESAITNLTTDLSTNSTAISTETSRATTAEALLAPRASPTFTGTVTIPTTVNATDAAQKAYVDGVAAGLAIKASVQEATAAALPTNTYLLGVITITATGTLTVDGIAVALNDRVLVKNEVTQANNGIYLCTTFGTSGVAAVLTRSSDMNQNSEVPGAFTFVEQGTVNAGSGFVVAGAGPYTIGTTAIVWTQFSGAGEVVAGTGLSKAANTLTVLNAALVPTAALYETFTRYTTSIAAQTCVTTDLYLTAIPLPAGLTIGHIAYGSTATGQTTPANWWFALFDNAFHMLAITADQTTTVWAANTLQSLAIATIASGASSTFTTTYSGLHYLGIMQKATTPATIVGMTGGAGTVIQALSPALGGLSSTAQSTPPAFPFTATTVVGAANAVLCYGYVAV